MNELLYKTENNIILDIVESWPPEIKLLIEHNEDLLHKYLDMEREIDQRAQEDVMLRVIRPHNKYEFDWSRIILEIEKILNVNKFVGFHCTKLTANEIENISSNGLKPLNSEMLNSRISELYENGMISKIASEHLKRNNRSSESNREGKTFFFHGANTLKDEFGLYRLFRLWGGEALFFNNEQNPNIYAELLHVGKPCIVLGSLNYEDVKAYPSLAYCFITVFLNKGNLDGINYDFDSCVKKDVKALCIINNEDVLFEQLTNFSSWRIDR